MLTLEKELEGGTRRKMTLMPSRSTASGTNFGNLVHEATVSVPLGDLGTRLIAGQMSDWTGYEAIPSNQNKLITHNLLFDFGATLAGGACNDTLGAPANCPDGCNGFGSGIMFDGANWVVADPAAGSNRGALSLGLHYALMPGVNVKGELRYDRASANVFQNADGQYLRYNQVIGVSTVVSF